MSALSPSTAGRDRNNDGIPDHGAADQQGSTQPQQTTTTTQATGQMQVVPGAAGGAGQINVADYAGQIIGDPSVFFGQGMKLAQNTPQIQPGTPGTQVNAADPRFQMNAGALNQTAQTATATTAGPAAQAQAPGTKAAQGYEAATTGAAVAQAQMGAAQGQVSNRAQVDADAVVEDLDATAAGQNAVGAALNQYASQGLTVIDTSTVAGKMLAQTLGEGNYTDSKATVKGQLDILSKEFVDSNGQPRIPTWAAGVARNVSRTLAFTGVTGTAAVAAMSQAIMEASLPIATQDASFFQTLTIKNLDNKQQSVINKANVLSRLQLANMDARLTAAVTNANSFMQMDLANLSNEQQARVINTQARVQSILEDANAQNVERRFSAESQNQMTQFYDNLSAQISQFNANQTNSMKQFDAQLLTQNAQFNVDQTNSMARFNAELENQREQYYKNMQYNIDIVNAKWRQDVTMQNNQNAFEAAAFDVRSTIGISTEMLNQLWDRSDALLDYVWKSSENEADRATQIAVSQLQADSAMAQLNSQQKFKAGSAVGSMFTNFLGSETGKNLVSGAVSKIGSMFGF